jgi:hypothetical protein
MTAWVLQQLRIFSTRWVSYQGNTGTFFLYNVLKRKVCQDFFLAFCNVRSILQLSLYSESSSYHDKKDVPRLTIPNPFNLHTDVCEMCF